MPFNYHFNVFMKIRNACENCSLNTSSGERRVESIECRQRKLYTVNSWARGAERARVWARVWARVLRDSCIKGHLQYNKWRNTQLPAQKQRPIQLSCAAGVGLSVAKKQTKKTIGKKSTHLQSSKSPLHQKRCCYICCCARLSADCYCYCCNCACLQFCWSCCCSINIACLQNIWVKILHAHTQRHAYKKCFICMIAHKKGVRAHERESCRCRCLYRCRCQLSVSWVAYMLPAATAASAAIELFV